MELTGHVKLAALTITLLASPLTVAVENSFRIEPLELRYTRSCGVCHTQRLGGAPGLKNQLDWSTRLNQGIDVLMEHTIQGYNNMPPLGYCYDCSRDDLKSLIQFMSETAK